HRRNRKRNRSRQRTSTNVHRSYAKGHEDMSIRSFAKRFANWIRRIEWPFINRRNSILPSRIFLWAPAYDDLTAHTADWATRLRVPRRFRRFFLTGSALTKLQIHECLAAHRDQSAIGVFCGHGAAEALLGPVSSNNTSQNVDIHEAIYDRDLIT